MARPREPIDLIAAKGRKHLTKTEYEERKKTEVEAPDDDIKAPSFLLKKEKEKFDILAKQLVDLKIMSNLDCDVLARYVKAETEYIKITKQLQKIHFTADKKSTVPEEEQLAEQYSKYNYLSKIQNRLMKACNENAKEWIVNTFLDNFFKVVFPVLYRGLIAQRGMYPVMVIPVHIIP